MIQDEHVDVQTQEGFHTIKMSELRLPRYTSTVHEVNTSIGAYVIQWNQPTDTGEFFTQNTDFRIEYYNSWPLIIQHGGNERVGNDMIGRITKIAKDEKGLRAEGYIDWDNPWHMPIRIHMANQKVILSMAPLAHLQSVDESGEIKEYPIGEFSLVFVNSENLQNLDELVTNEEVD